MRKDGKRVHSSEAMYHLIPYVLKYRYDAMNMVTLDIPYEPMQNYLNAKRKEGMAISHLALIIGAYLRTAAEFPNLNRFVVNKKIYARNEFPVAMVVLKPGEVGTMGKMYMELEDTIFDVQRKIDEYVETNRKVGDNNKLDKLMTTLLNLPGLLSFSIGGIKLLDKWGILPKSIIDASPFHASLTISNLASIRTNHIYHHLYEFGTSSMFVTLGNSREVLMRTQNGVEPVKCMPLGVVMDERIASGTYFATCFGRIKAYLNDPRLLEEPPKVVNRD